MYQSKLASPAVDRFFQALLTLQTQEDCYRFFEDVATIGELNAMAQRFQVAEPLAAGESYTAGVKPMPPLRKKPALPPPPSPG